MAHNKQSGRCTHAEKKESVLLIRMIRVINKQSVLVSEDCLSFFERHAMFALIDGVLAFVPSESQWYHVHNVVIV